jgi:sugar lactone lactonase YvrE
LLEPSEREAAAAAMAENRTPLEASTVAAEVPNGFRLIEAVVRDPRSGRLFASSVVSRQLLQFDGGRWQPVPGLETGSVFGLAVDPARRRLWLATGTANVTPSPETAVRGLIAINLDDLRVVRRVHAPAPDVMLGDLLAVPDGTVYASDPVGGRIFRLAPGGERLETVLGPGRMRSPQGMALSPDGRRLYVADYSYGIAVLDLASGALTRLASDRPMMLSGIDGLFAAGGDLVAIQNGTSPRRIVRIALDRSGQQATALHVLERNVASWGEPTQGQFADGTLLYVADAQWERFGDGGTVQGEGAPRPTPIQSLRIGR